MICGRRGYVRFFCAAPLLAATIAFAGDPWIVTGRVVGVSDGDTITVLDADKKQHKVRINGIDAPEKGQAFGERSRQSLAQMTHGKDARIECHKVDRFGREVCKVWVQPLDGPSCGKTLDVGLAQINVGLAWWYRRRRAVTRGPRTLQERGGRSPPTQARALGGQSPGAAVGVAQGRSGATTRAADRPRLALDVVRDVPLATAPLRCADDRN